MSSLRRGAIRRWVREPHCSCRRTDTAGYTLEHEALWIPLDYSGLRWTQHGSNWSGIDSHSIRIVLGLRDWMGLDCKPGYTGELMQYAGSKARWLFLCRWVSVEQVRSKVQRCSKSFRSDLIRQWTLGKLAPIPSTLSRFTQLQPFTEGNMEKKLVVEFQQSFR